MTPVETEPDLPASVGRSLLFMCQVPSHASLSVKQINEQHKVGSGEGDLNFGSKIIA